jgi:hypothetical protein
MTNNDKSPGVIKATLSDGELLALLNASGLKPSRLSPLAGIKGNPSSLNSAQGSGLVDASGRPTPACLEALNILANPASEIDLLWGNPDGINFSKAYAAAGQDRMVSFTGNNGKNNFSYFLSSNDIAEVMTQNLATPVIKDITALNLEIPASAVPAFFALLDIYREAQLRAALEHHRETTVNVTADDLNRTGQEAKTDANFDWYTPTAYAALPQDSAITEAMIKQGFNTLKKEGLIGNEGGLSGSFTSFANRAFPIIGFFGVNILTANPGSLEKTQLALFRGPSTLLLVQLTTENGEPQAQVSSIATAQLPELLFNFGTRIQESKAPTAAPAPAPAYNSVVCSECGTANTRTAKFCIKCGATVAVPAPARFCTKCGTPAAGGEKFCKKCGSPIK